MGTTEASSFETHGNPALSPRPSSMRSAINIAKLLVAPVRTVADAQMTSPAASTRCAP